MVGGALKFSSNSLIMTIQLVILLADRLSLTKPTVPRLRWLQLQMVL